MGNQEFPELFSGHWREAWLPCTQLQRDFAHLALSKITDYGSVTSPQSRYAFCEAAKLHNYRHNTLKIGPVPAQPARAWHPSTVLPRVAVLIGAVAPSQVTDEVTGRTTASNHRDH